MTVKHAVCFVYYKLLRKYNSYSFESLLTQHPYFLDREQLFFLLLLSCRNNDGILILWCLFQTYLVFNREKQDRMTYFEGGFFTALESGLFCSLTGSNINMQQIIS